MRTCASNSASVVVFAIVTTERLVGERISQTSRHLASGVIVAGALLVTLLGFIRDRYFNWEA